MMLSLVEESGLRSWERRGFLLLPQQQQQHYYYYYYSTWNPKVGANEKGVVLRIILEYSSFK
jgi:hypothetical protein